MTERPTRIDYDGLMACARGEMFGPGNPQLPAPPMLMMDRITDISADRGAATARATSSPSSTSAPTSGSSSATSSATR